MLYAVGDIHGQLDELENALSLIKDDGGPNATIVFLGDYTDRGPNSCGVIERLIEGKQSSKSWHFLKGNHDRMFSWYLKLNPIHDPHLFHGLHWLHPRMGGENTLLSYGVTLDQERRSGEIHSEARQKIPKTHVNFLNSLDLMYRTSDLAFVHAGIRPGVKLDAQKENDLLWIREGFIDDKTDHGPLIVHGHMALDKPTHFGNRIDLDGGAAYGRALTPVVFEGRNCWTLTSKGRQSLEQK